MELFFVSEDSYQTNNCQSKIAWLTCFKDLNGNVAATSFIQAFTISLNSNNDYFSADYDSGSNVITLTVKDNIQDRAIIGNWLLVALISE